MDSEKGVATRSVGVSWKALRKRVFPRSETVLGSGFRLGFSLMKPLASPQRVFPRSETVLGSGFGLGFRFRI